MDSQENQQPNIGRIFRSILQIILVTVLPGVRWTLFGWLHMFLPVTTLVTLGRHGRYTGNRLLAISIALSCIIYLLLGNFELFIFSTILLSSGYALFLSSERGDPPALSWLKGSLVMAGGWVAIIFVLSLGTGVSPYGELVRSLDEGISEALKYYRQSDDVSGETLTMLEETLYRMKVVIPIIMPSILGSFVLGITWMTMALGNILLQRSSGQLPWPRCRFWQLPEKAIWIVIGAGIIALLPIHPFRFIGINLLILSGIVYCFQGLSIAIFFMNKWKVPLLLRSFFYVMMIFQSFGTLLLLIFGIADIWFDFRKLKNQID